MIGCVNLLRPGFEITQPLPFFDTSVCEVAMSCGPLSLNFQHAAPSDDEEERKKGPKCDRPLSNFA